MFVKTIYNYKYTLVWGFYENVGQKTAGKMNTNSPVVIKLHETST